MSWLDRLRDASFRGVPFQVSESEAEFGRRKVVHEFPGRDVPFTEDMGRKARKWPVKGYVVGNDYFRIKNLLIAAAEKEGSGLLVHPYYGIKTVECMSLTVSESTENGGMAELSFEFVEAGTALFPIKSVDQVIALIDAVDTALNQIAINFSEAFSVLSLPTYIVESAANMVEDLAKTISSGAGIGSSISSLSELPEAVGYLSGNAIELVKSPFNLAARTRDTLFTLVNSLIDKTVAVDSVLNVASLLKARPRVTINTSTRIKERRNQDAISLLVSAQATAIASRAAIDAIKNQQTPPNTATNSVVAANGDIVRNNSGGSDSEEILITDRPRVVSSLDAISMKDKISNAIDDVLNKTTDDTLFSVLSDLRALLSLAITGGSELPDVVKVEHRDPTPALVLAYDRYGTLNRELDVIDRNGAEHPGAVSGMELEFLSS